VKTFLENNPHGSWGHANFWTILGITLVNGAGDKPFLETNPMQADFVTP
jgi:hypothetical protein